MVPHGGRGGGASTAMHHYPSGRLLPSNSLSLRGGTGGGGGGGGGKRVGGAGAGSVPSLREFLKPFSHTSAGALSGGGGGGGGGAAGGGGVGLGRISPPFPHSALARSSGSKADSRSGMLPSVSSAATRAASTATAAATAATAAAPPPFPARTGRDKLLLTVLPPTSGKLMAKASASPIVASGPVSSSFLGGAGGRGVGATAKSQPVPAQRQTIYWSL